MPCQSGGYESTPEPTVRKVEHDRALAELHKVTRLLCERMAETADITASKELSEWWTKHQEQDKIRLQREALEKQLAKLDKQAAKLRKDITKLKGKR
jgi:hypothetical protein